ncbi:uncharacterized protein TrAtP1_007461 [Trichoderma atroviride]|uniref:peptidylprolyl isomerase n=1 Tax=Hypocrea atroviridis (strain ATCC 20476 / IMI 206040) TaxID=452589 RepID=G9NGG6_HYPAI|nr:uncharacterized protein TRIATDRAFT_297179 [Trichoderma atroviride IMI 206040]EHK50377.1 hypothetical protein TRIATDRAFT_297179 [Trichoderma atroviride IMI 206040]UKZ66286.1 hypothetical protein TrAtP1_007461 [Trichoderma atroviride]
MSVTVTTLQQGSGESPLKGDKIVMHYTGWLKDTSQPENKGKQFDSSIGRGTFETAIGVGSVIGGWDHGVPTMKVGGKARLEITSDWAYGARGYPPIIPARSDLIFDVELLNFIPAPADQRKPWPANWFDNVTLN